MVLATPTSMRRHPAILYSRESSNAPTVSFDKSGISSLSNFDGFFGSGNFNGDHNQQVIIKEKTVECKQIDVTLIQQRLTVLRELVKKVIVEQVCEVEVQTVVLEQFRSGMKSFSDDVQHKSSRQVSYDQSVTSLLSQLQNSVGSLSSNDLGFSGSSVGKSSIMSNGTNWNDQSSPNSVGAIYNQSIIASKQAQGKNVTSKH